MKHASKGIQPGFETQDRHHQKSKLGVSVAPKIGLMSLKFEKMWGSDGCQFVCTKIVHVRSPELLLFACLTVVRPLHSSRHSSGINPKVLSWPATWRRFLQQYLWSIQQLAGRCPCPPLRFTHMSLQWKQYRACCRCREQQAGSRNRDQSAVEVAVVEAGEEVQRHTGSERPVVHSAVLTHCADRRWHTHRTRGCDWPTPTALCKINPRLCKQTGSLRTTNRKFKSRAQEVFLDSVTSDLVHGNNTWPPFW